PGGLFTDLPDTPTSYGTAMPTIAGVAALAPTAISGTAAIGAAFLMFVALPSELLRATLQANYPRAFAWLAPLRRVWGSLGARPRMRLPRWLGATLLFGLASL